VGKEVAGCNIAEYEQGGKGVKSMAPIYLSGYPLIQTYVIGDLSPSVGSISIYVIYGGRSDRLDG
jgi:hypothetical protein